VCDCRYAAASVDVVQQDPRGAVLETVTITGLQATHPPHPRTHTHTHTSVAICVAMLDCLQRTLLGSVFRLIFLIPWSWQCYLGEQQNHDVPWWTSYNILW